MVGEKTGGSAEGTTAGLLFTLTLPASKITTRIPYFRYTNNVNVDEKGMGVIPDIEVSNRVSSLMENEDIILNTAIELAAEESNAAR